MNYVYAVFQQIGECPMNDDLLVSIVQTTQFEIARKVEWLHELNPDKKFYFINTTLSELSKRLLNG